jgi:hypothetical protein
MMQMIKGYGLSSIKIAITSFACSKEVNCIILQANKTTKKKRIFTSAPPEKNMVEINEYTL